MVYYYIPPFFPPFCTENRLGYQTTSHQKHEWFPKVVSLNKHSANNPFRVNTICLGGGQGVSFYTNLLQTMPCCELPLWSTKKRQGLLGYNDLLSLLLLMFCFVLFFKSWNLRCQSTRVFSHDTTVETKPLETSEKSPNCFTTLASWCKVWATSFLRWEKIPVERREGGGFGNGWATSAPPHCVGFVLLIRPHASRIEESESSQPAPLIPHTAAAACDKLFSVLWG